MYEANLTVKTIICHGRLRELETRVTPHRVEMPCHRSRYVLPGVKGNYLNCLGVMKDLDGEMIWVEDSLSSFLTYAKL